METQTLFRNQLERLHDTSAGFLPGGASAFISDRLSTDSELSRSFFRSSSVNIASTSSGTLATNDPTNPTRSGSFRDDYFLTGVTAGQQVQVNLKSTAFNTYLQVVNADTGAVVTFDDDSGLGLNSRLTFTAQQSIRLYQVTPMQAGMEHRWHLPMSLV